MAVHQDTRFVIVIQDCLNFWARTTADTDINRLEIIWTVRSPSPQPSPLRLGERVGVRGQMDV